MLSHWIVCDVIMFWFFGFVSIPFQSQIYHSIQIRSQNIKKDTERSEIKKKKDTDKSEIKKSGTTYIGGTIR